MSSGNQSMEILSNCIFSGNLAKYGGGMHIGWRWEHPDPNIVAYIDSKLVNCTFTMNRAQDYGGGISTGEKSRPMLTNCVLWSNHDGAGTDESAQVWSPTGQQAPQIDHCCIQGWSGKVSGAANFGLDPRFVDPNGPDGKIGTLDDNLRLNINSPCINAGDNAALPADAFDLDGDGDPNEPIPFDINGKPRIQGGTVDIGACESG